MDEAELKSTFRENMEGIFKDQEARSDEEVLDFYCDVAVTIAKTYSQHRISEELLNLHIKHCECGDESTGFMVLNSCNICGHHVTEKPKK